MFDTVSIIKAAGYLGIFAIIFAESGLMVGFFLPGDSLLFTAGFLASQNYVNIFVLILITFLGAVLGDNAGYAIGLRFGPKIFKRDDSLFFHKDHIRRAERFYEKHGAKTIVIARFTPIIRTFAPVVAGVGTMRYGTFFVYNLVGGALWGVGIPLAGYFLGSLIPGVDKYLIPIVGLIILLSVIPGAIQLFRGYRKHKSESG